MHRDRPPRFVERLHLAPDADHAGRAALEVAGEIFVVMVGPAARHDDPHVAAEQLVDRVAEDLLREGIDLLDDAPRGDADDPHRRTVEQRLIACQGPLEAGLLPA